MTAPHRTSAMAMAMFDFVYLWYLTVVLLWKSGSITTLTSSASAETRRGPLKWVYSILTLGSHSVSLESRRIEAACT